MAEGGANLRERARSRVPVSRLTYEELGNPTSAGRTQPQVEGVIEGDRATQHTELEMDLESENWHASSDKKSPSRKAKSVKSGASRKSVDLMKEEAELNCGQQISELMKKRIPQQAKVNKLKKELRDITSKLDDLDWKADEKPTYDQFKAKHNTISKAQEKEEEIKEEESMLALIDHELELIRQQKKVTLRTIAEEYDSQEENSSETSPANSEKSKKTVFKPHAIHTSTPVDPQKRVAAWIEKTKPGGFTISSDGGSSKEERSTSPANSERASENLLKRLVDVFEAGFSKQQKQDIVVKTIGEKSLPEFGGAPEDWTIFQAEYERTTKEFKLSDSQNATRLRKALRGKAKEFVAHLLPHVANAPVIMHALQERFGQPRYILEALSKKVRDCPAPSISKPESIVNLDIAVKSLVATIHATKNPLFLNNLELLTAVENKLPPEMCRQWHGFRVEKNKLGTIGDFSEWLSAEAKFAILRLKPEPDSGKFDKEEKRVRPKRGSGSVNFASVTEENKVKSCPLCKKPHALSACFRFQKMSVNERWEAIKSIRPGICVSCFKPGHRSYKCLEAKKCGVDGCEQKHHPLFHSRKEPPPAAAHIPSRRENSSENENRPSGSVCITMINGEAVIEGCDGPLPIVPVLVKGPLGTRRTHALLDTGASRSLISKELADLVGLKGDPHSYSYESISGNKVTESNAAKVDFEVAGAYRGAHFLPMRKAVTVTSMKMRPYSMKFEEIKEAWPHLKKIRGRNLVKVIPELIVGSNNPTLILARELAVGPPNAPVGWKTPLGWAISGDFDDMMGNHCGSINATTIMHATDDHLHEMMKDWFSTENFGVVPPRRKGENRADVRDYNTLAKTTKKIGDRWETGLLWKDENVSLPDSYEMALSRLKGMEKKMTRDPEFAACYDGKFQEYLEKGYIRKLSPEQIPTRNKRTWYIPHFAVTNPNKPGKTRLVFDAAAKVDGVSLNDALSKGPDRIRPLTTVLWNYRSHAYALTGDICDMFHRVQVIKEDQDSQRFLWRNGESWREPDHYTMCVLIFGATSSPCSAIYVKDENAMVHADDMEDTAYTIVSDFYVDDCLTGAPTPAALIQLRKEISEICEAGGFKVCKFMSNSREVLVSIPKDLRADGVKALEEKELLPVKRVLGMWWDSTEDVFTFKISMHKVPKEIFAGDIPTKRQATSLVMSIFDPLGLIGHFKIKGIMLLQRTWIAGIGWDDELPSDLYEAWRNWLQRHQDIVQVKVPRFFGLDPGMDVELHVFVDASQEAFSAVAYLRMKSKDQVQTVLFGSKVRVTPLRKLTIPRAELQAALLGARYAHAICRETVCLRGKRRVFWSDSRTVLTWIPSDAGRYKEFVANRVGEAQELTKSEEWKWVPTKENPADIATRFETEISFHPDCVWFNGPSFLKKPEEFWPQEKTNEGGVIAATLLENAERAEENSKEISRPLHALYQMDQFSSLTRLVRKVASLQKMALFWRDRSRARSFGGDAVKDIKELEIGPLNLRIGPEDYDAAMLVLVKWTQSEEFPKEVNQLKNLKPVKNSKIARLSPCMIQGVMCLKSRLVNADIPLSQKTPAILPAKHPFTELLIQHEHEKCAHQGQETVLNNLRRRYWIVDGRQSVLRVTRNCPACRLRRVSPVIPEMAALPDYRLAAYQSPFTFTGVDFFGPLYVTVGRRHEKRWGVIFTCLVTRGIHLEVAYGLSTDECMMAVSRFIDSRGRPNTIFSDNGTNFVGASKELKIAAETINWDQIASSDRFGPINWRFNPPAAPHFGGAWERLIKSVKKCMYACLNEQYPKDTTLLTALKSAETIINSRPITHVSNDPTDADALTPNHFLRGENNSGPSIPVKIDTSEDHLREQWKRSQLLAEQFWKRWTRDYLPSLMIRSKWHAKTEPIKVGDLVFLVDENLPRNMWKRGYISKVILGSDKQVRVVEVTSTDGSKKTTYKRSVTKVCRLGLRMEIPGSEFQKSGVGM